MTPKRTGFCRLNHSKIALVFVALSVTLGLSPRALGQTKSGFTYNGIVYTSWWFNEYGNYADPPIATGAATTSSGQLVGTNAGYASVLVTQYVQTGSSTTIAPLVQKTPLDDQVAFAIQGFHNQGLKVFLKPHVDSVDGTWRGQFTPTSPADWFASFQTFIVHYAQLAQENNVEGLVIGTEYKTLSGAAYESNWATIIAAVRAVYTGLVAYGANATGPGDEFTTVSFWPLVDIIGVDGYFGLTNQKDPTVSQLVSGWTNSTENSGFNALAALENLSSTYNKPVVFTELGYESTTGTNSEPWNSSLNNGYDPTEQANCYEAFFEVFSQQTSWMKGVFWWNWQIPALAANDTGYDPNGKPAGTAELPLWFGSATPAFKLSPSSSSLSLAQNGSATETISVIDEAGFSGGVALSVSGLPTGVTAAFGMNPATGSSVLTLTASGGATAGTSTIKITGTSGGLTATTSISLSVTVSACNVVYTIGSQWQGGFGTAITINNLGTAPLPTWTLTWPFSNGQTITQLWGGTFTQTGQNVTVTGTTNIPAGGSYTSLGFNGTWNNVTNAVPTSFALNNTPCTIGSVSNPSFTLAAAATSLSVTQASSATDTITVTDLGGFTGSVTLEASGLPSGVTATFGTNPTTGSSVVTVAAGGTAATGPAMVTITGTSGGKTASTTIALTVNPKVTAGFTLSASRTSLSVTEAGSATDTITVTDVGGFTGAVTLAATDLPSGVTASFDTNPASTTSVLTLSAASTAAAGVFTITITGTSGSTTADTTITLTIGATPAFTLAPSAASLSTAQGACGSDTITVTPASGFTGSVTMAASGLPSGVTASFGTNPTTTTSVMTLCASSTAATGTRTLTVTGNSGTATASATVALNVTAANGSVTITPVVSSNSPFFVEEDLELANTSPITALSITISVARTTGISFSGEYNTVGGGITQGDTSTSSTVTYTFTLNSGQTLSAGSYLFAAQISGTGTAHPTSGDTFSVTYTAGGTTTTQTGHF